MDKTTIIFIALSLFYSTYFYFLNNWYMKEYKKQLVLSCRVGTPELIDGKFYYIVDEDEYVNSNVGIRNLEKIFVTNGEGIK